ncbi:MAG: hydroxyacid dehydrogenase [Alphaproteobacteria bacterium]|nr:hydroxyacid dehydrogenase [Alphaproteobacteria bacterium]
MKVVVFEAEPREAKAFDRLKAEVEFVSGPLNADNAARFANAELISTFIYSAPNRSTLEQLPRLRFIATRSTGYDHIDTAYCTERGITVSNVPNYGENTVAEHVFALLLALSHRLIEATQRARSGRFSPEGLQGFDLAGKTLGVIGTGAIGRHVVRIGKGFGMNILAHDLSVDASFAQQAGFKYVPLGDLLAQSDVVTLHVPAMSSTQHMLSDETFAAMKDGVVVINTARGSLIDARALIKALRSGKVAGAGLDVLPDEPLIREEAELICSSYYNRQDLRDLIADHVLLSLPNVVITPHSAFNTREAIDRIVDTTIENIDAFIGGSPQNVVGRLSAESPAP